MNDLMIGLVRFYAGNWSGARSELDAAVQSNVESYADCVYPSAAILERAYAGESDALDGLHAASFSLLTMPDENPVGVWEQLV